MSDCLRIFFFTTLQMEKSASLFCLAICVYFGGLVCQLKLLIIIKNRNLTDNRLNHVSPLSTLKSCFKLMVFKKKSPVCFVTRHLRYIHRNH